MKRILLILSAVLLALTALCSCEKDEKAITVFSEKCDAVSSFAEKFEQETGIKINYTKSALEADVVCFEPSAVFSGENNLLLNLTDKSFLTDTSLFSNGFVYGIPAETNLYYLACNRKYIDYPEGITTLSDLKITIEELIENKSVSKENIFAPLPNDAEYISDLLSIPVFAELSENDDFDNPLFAAANAKKLAFRYGEETRDILTLYKKYSTAPVSKKEAYDNFKSGKSVFMAVSSKDFTLTDDFAAVLLSLSGDADMLYKCEKYLGINKNSSEEKIKLSEEFLKFYSDNNSAEISRALPVLSPAFSDNFKNASAKAVTDFIKGGDWEEAQEKIKLSWENGHKN